VAEAGGDERLGDIAGVVGSGAIDLGRILSGVSTTSMGAPTTVRVDDDLSSSDASISGGTTDIEFTGRVNHVNSAFFQEFARANLLDDLLNKSLSDCLVAHLRVVLSGDEDVEDSGRLEVFSLVFRELVLNNNLRFAVRSEPFNLTRVSLSSHLHVDSAGELMGKRVESLLVVLVGGVAEHNTLITSADVSKVLLSNDSSSDVFVLSFDDGDNGHFGSVHALLP